MTETIAEACDRLTPNLIGARPGFIGNDGSWPWPAQSIPQADMVAGLLRGFNVSRKGKS